jgi:hypothetical protein
VFVGAGATVVLGGLTIWSGLDTQAAREDYDQNPTPEGLDEGRGKQRRTNLLLGVTAAVGVATGVIALWFTEWKPSKQSHADVLLQLGPTSIAVYGSF